MSDLRKAAEMALNALDRVRLQVRGAIPQQDTEDAIDALRAALAEPDDVAAAVEAEREASSQLPTAKDSLPVAANARRDAIELADALDQCCDELLIFGNDFSKPLIEAAAELRRLHNVNAALLWALQQIADETYDVWTNGAKAQRIAERAIKEAQT
ncbi:MAG: hypothetical protein RI988_706 [Pseudomonadota bacterium]